MTHKELITQMLEALKVATTPLAKDRQEVLAAIAAARKYLAAPEQSEPVAWISKHGHMQGNHENLSKRHADEYSASPDWTPLYTHPASKAEPVNQMLLEALREMHSVYGNGMKGFAHLDRAAAAIAAAEQAQGAPEMSTNKIMELADTYACNRHADGHAHLAETPNTAKARAALQAEVERVTQELAASEAINKAAPKAEQPVNQMILEALKEAVEDIEAWAGYASEYFQHKHDLQGTLEKHRAAIAEVEGEK